MTSIPKSSAGARPAREIKEGEMLIKGEEVATERRLEDLKKKNLEKKRERERERAEEAKERYNVLLFSC